MTPPAMFRRPELTFTDFRGLCRQDPAGAVRRLRVLLRDPIAVAESCRLAAGIDVLFGDILPRSVMLACDFGLVVDALAGRCPPEDVSPDLLSAVLADEALTRQAAVALSAPCSPNQDRTVMPREFNQDWKTELFEKACRWLPEEAPLWEDVIDGWPEPIFAGKKEVELRRLGVKPEAGLEIPSPTGIRCSRLAGGERWRPMNDFQSGCKLDRRGDAETGSLALSVSETDGGSKHVEFHARSRDTGADAGWRLYHLGGPAADEKGVVGQAGENLLLRWADDGAGPENAAEKALLAGEDPSGEAMKVLLDDGRVAAAWTLARRWVESPGWRKSFPAAGPEHDPDWVTGRKLRGRMWLLHFHAAMIRLAAEAKSEAGDRLRTLRKDVEKPLQMTFFALTDHGPPADPE